MTQPCELCYMNPPHDVAEGGEVTFLPVPEALPDDTMCADCRQQCDEWARSAEKHREENHQAPWEHNCMMCSLNAYGDDREKSWQAHLARCKECQEALHDFVATPRHCRNCGVEEGAGGIPSICAESYTREMHRDLC